MMRMNSIRLCCRAVSSMHQHHVHHQCAALPTRSLAIKEFATDSTGGGAGGLPSDEDAAAAARRAALLKRYGDRTTSEPVAVEAAAEDAEGAAKEEADHNEIWGDYVQYMQHQRKKGWKT